MQTVIDPITWVGTLDQADAQCLADKFVMDRLGPNFYAYDPQWMEQNRSWSFFIQCRFPDLDRPIVAGRLHVDAEAGHICGMDEDELLTIQECAQIQAQRQRGHRLAYNAEGLILPYHAQIKAGVYVSDEIAFFAGAEGRPVLIDSEPSVWRVATVLRLRNRGIVIPLGPVDVNAVTGEVIPLPSHELQTRRKRVEYAASPAQCATAAAS